LGGKVALRPGSMLGGRYEILRRLGEGGMGAVYKAKDRELNRFVALKVILPELASNPEALQRFRQEVILAQQVTQKNVIRIFDLGEADGIKFISMEYIEGQDLRSLLKQKKKLPPNEAAGIMVQVSQALQAAHSEGVVHRDLKPQNIMIDAEGKLTVMDFGIAHSAELTGMTQTGALLGTPEYMSPEQARGQKADARSDVFSLGIIVYELLTGETPYRADTVLATLLKRTQEKARPLTELDPTIPRYLGDIVAKCLETDPGMRYQKASEVQVDLEARRKPRTTIPWLRLTRFRIVEEHPTKWIAPALGAILLLAVAAFRTKIFRPGIKTTPTTPAISLAIVPFRNASGDPSLDWVGPYLAETLRTAVGQSPSLRMVSPDRIGQTMHDLQLAANSALDPTVARHISESSDAQELVWGQYVKFGDEIDEIKVEATFQDFKSGRTAKLKAEAANRDALPATVDRLAQAVRENLSLSSSLIKELQEQALRPSSRSIAALRDYNEGLELARQRRDLDARKRLEAATQEDPGFALAYAKLSEVYSGLGYENEAEQASGKAVELSGNLPAPEKFRIAASHLRVLRDYPKAVKAYENLAKATPNDTDVQSALGSLYLNSGAYDKARALYGGLLEHDPKSADALFGMGQVEVMTGNLQTALDYLNRALTIAIQLENDEDKALILHVVGIAYRKLNKPDEAMRNYQESLAITRRLGEKAAMARSLNEMGQLLYGVGKSDEALKNYQDALKLRRDMGDKKGIGDTLIDLGNLYNERGDLDQALQRYQESLQIQRDLGDEFSQSICLNNMGNVYFVRGGYQEALTFYQQALQLREKLKVPAEIAETVHNLGDTSLRKGQFDQALSRYLRALELYRGLASKRDVAIESHSTAMGFEYQGRYCAALNAEEEALKVFRGLQDRGFWMGDILSGYGNALSLVGRSEEAQKNLDEAVGLAREIKSEPLVAQILNYQGDLSFYKGDLKSARSQYEQALRSLPRLGPREGAGRQNQPGESGRRGARIPPSHR
jgi:serine/threonine protein kinase/Tfp pilus assembly protein PilF